MLDAFLLIGLPYMAVLVCVVGSIYRFRNKPFTVTPRSSLFFERKWLRWASAPWHIGIIPILIAHILAFLFPTIWQMIMASRTFLIAMEILGLALALCALLGIGLMLIRKIVVKQLQAITGMKTIVILTILLVQVLLGILTAMNYRWGGLWYASSIAPYLWSMITLTPDITYVQAMPFIVKLHIAFGFLILLLIPFTRLIHIFAIPYQYLYRLPQRVLWTRPQTEVRSNQMVIESEARRNFMKAGIAMSAGGILLALGVSDKLIRFFQKPTLDSTEESELLSIRLKRLQMTAEEKELELERRQKEYILIGRLNELNDKKGKYFIDYEMRPALAFLFADGFPILISAKCTHLGCTVGSDLDSNGRILCPCHVSYFDIRTGEPNVGAPAKTPLPHIGWVIMDLQKNIVAKQSANGKPEGNFDRTKLEQYQLYIARQYQTETV